MHGIYQDDCEGLDVATINECYGVHGEPQHWNIQETGVTASNISLDLPSDHSDTISWHDDDEDNNVMEVDEVESGSDVMMNDIVEEVVEDQDDDLVDAPAHISPFPHPDDLNAFLISLDALQTQGGIPPGYGLLPEEWDETGYPAYEVIGSGRAGNGKKKLTILLPDEVWRPRALHWVQALYLLNTALYAMSTD